MNAAKNCIFHRITLYLILLSFSRIAFADQIVEIGNAAPLTGGIAHLGKDIENGSRLAIEEINAKGLVIGGRKVMLVLDSQDDAADPKTATQVAQKLVDDKVVAVIGHMNSGTTIPASKIYHDADITQISPASTNPTYTQQGFSTAYRVVATDAQQGPALASYGAKRLGLKTVAIVDDSTAYGQGLATTFEQTARSLGVKVLSHDATTDKSIDFRAVLTKIKGENPDAIMFGGMDATGGPLSKQAKQLGIRSRILGGDGLCSTTLTTLAGDATDNVVCSEAGMALEKMPGGKEFAEKFEKRFGQPVQIYSPFAYDAVYIVVDAMKRADSTDPAKILAAMPATDHRGVTGEIKFDSRGDLKSGTISLYKFVNGKKTLLDVIGGNGT